MIACVRSLPINDRVGTSAVRKVNAMLAFSLRGLECKSKGVTLRLPKHWSDYIWNIMSSFWSLSEIGCADIGGCF